VINTLYRNLVFYFDLIELYNQTVKFHLLHAALLALNALDSLLPGLEVMFLHHVVSLFYFGKALSSGH